MIRLVLLAALFLSACVSTEHRDNRTIRAIETAVTSSLAGWHARVLAGKSNPAEQAIVDQIHARYITAMKRAKETRAQSDINAASYAAEDLVVWIAEYVPTR